MSKLEAMLEAERRGILPADKQAVLTEARKRGLVPQLDSTNPVDTPERQALKRRLDEDTAAVDKAGRKLALYEAGSEYVARPILGTLTNLADGNPLVSLPRLLVNKGIDAVNQRAGTSIQSVPSLTDAGQLTPRNDNEQLAATVTRGVGGVIGGLGLGSALARTGGAASGTANVGRALTANGGLQATGAVTGGVSSEVARREGAGPVGQAAAGILGAIAPSLAVAGTQAATRGALRGGEAGRQQVQENIDTFARAGTTPTVGQATERRSLQAVENVLSGLPGGSAPIARKAQGLAEEIGTRIDDSATQLSGRTSAEQAGRTITRGVEGPGGFVQQSRATQEALYARLDQQIPAATPTSVSNTQTALRELTRIDPGAPQTTAGLVNPTIRRIADDLAADAQTGVIPYRTLQALRTRVGEMLDDGIVADVPQRQLRRLYSALSDDLRGAANRAGPAAQQAFNRANNYTRARAQRLEVLDEVLIRNGGPEAVFKAATSGTAEGATRLRAVMQSLDDAGQRAVTATVIRRLGRATPGQQDDVGGRFSTETFLTNLSRLSPEARRTLFERFGPQFEQDMSAVARVASNLRDGSKVYANPSRTAPRVAAQTAAVGFITALGTGNLGVASGIAAGVGSANLAARLMTNPNFVRFLARSTEVPASAYTSQLNQLAQLVQDTGDPELQEAYDALKQVPPSRAQQRQAPGLVSAPQPLRPLDAAPIARNSQPAAAAATPTDAQRLAQALLEAEARRRRPYGATAQAMAEALSRSAR